MDDQCSNHNCHEGGAHKECISVREGCVWWGFKDEIVIDSFTLPHEQIAPMHEQVQAQQRKHAAQFTPLLLAYQ